MDGLELFTVDECRATVCDVPNLIILTIEQGDQELSTRFGIGSAIQLRDWLQSWIELNFPELPAEVEIDDSDIPF
jgi:hypothetical protein